MSSSEPAEIISLTDCLLVLHEGSLVATLISAETAPDDVLNYAAGLAASVQ